MNLSLRILFVGLKLKFRMFLIPMNQLLRVTKALMKKTDFFNYLKKPV